MADQAPGAHREVSSHGGRVRRFLAFLDSTIVNVAFPDIQRSFPDSSISSLSWVLNAYNIVFAAFLVAAGRLAVLALADVVISPDAAGVGLLEFHQIDAMRESGRLAARAALPAIQAVLARPSASRQKM